MKPPLLLSLLLLTCIFANSQTASWQWAQSGGGITAASGAGVQTDASGNVYITGTTYGPFIIFGNDTIVNNDTSGLSSNFFLLKYSEAGSLIRGKDMVTAGYGGSVALSIDAAGNIYMAGSFITSTLIIQTDTLLLDGNTSGSFTFFVAKYNPAGSLIWAKTTDTSMNILSMATNAAGDVFITGYYTYSTVTWGNDTLTNVAIDSRDGFVAKFDSSGNKIWAASIGGSGDEISNSVAADAGGNSYITGIYGSPTATLNNITLTNESNNGFNIFIAKYDPQGNIAWAKSAGGSVGEQANGIALDTRNNVYITGGCSSPNVTFGNIILLNPDTGAGGYASAFIAKYDPSGNAVWAKSAISNNGASGAGISTGADGAIYLTGDFSGRAIVFGADTLFNTDSVDQTNDIFIARCDSSGNFMRAISAGGTENDFVSGVAADGNGNAYITGSCSSPVMYFGNDSIIGIDDEESNNIFIAKYGTMTSGIANEPPPASNILVYPNPSAGQFYFKGVNDGSILEVYNVMGQNIYSSAVNSDTYLLNIASHARGIYFYRVVDKNAAIQQGKIVLE